MFEQFVKAKLVKEACGLCHDEGRVMQNPTGDHDGANWLSCPVCQTDRLREECQYISGASLDEDRLRALKAKYGR